MKRFLSLIFLLLILLFSAFGSIAQIRILTGKYVSAEALDKFLHQQMDSLGVPGLSIAVINNDQIVYHNAMGFANIDTKAKVDEQSVFEAASMSKPVFAYLVMKMVDKGLLNLDTPLYKYMPYPDIDKDERYK